MMSFLAIPLYIFSISDKKILENEIKSLDELLDYTDNENDNKTINDLLNNLIKSINEIIKELDDTKGKYDKFQLLYAITSLFIIYTVFSTL